MARQRLGQHFLVDRRAIDAIVKAMDPSRDEPLLEIGPGRGALTAALIQQTGRIAAVEVDPVLADFLERRFDRSQLLLLRQDVLRLDLQQVIERMRLPPTTSLRIAGNLPYNISKPVAQKLIRERSRVARAVLMFQREVAERLTAKPGSKRYGPLGILAGEAYTIRRLFDVGPTAFRPRPKVVSSVTLWEPREGTRLSDRDEARLRFCLRVCFTQRRRTLRNNLRGVIPDERALDAALREVGLIGSERAEELPAEAFRRLAPVLDRARHREGEPLV